MIFLTVGTSFPFDRLVQAVDAAVAKGLVADTVFAQVGVGGYRPVAFESIEILSKDAFDRYFQEARAVVAHAGMGTISMALGLNKPLLVMPRLPQHGELVNGHQLATAKRFEALGHVLAVYRVDDVARKVAQLALFRPLPRVGRAAAVSGRVGDFISETLVKLGRTTA